jgi:hypothetical protein
VGGISRVVAIGSKLESKERRMLCIQFKKYAIIIYLTFAVGHFPLFQLANCHGLHMLFQGIVGIYSSYLQKVV